MLDLRKYIIVVFPERKSKVECGKLRMYIVSRVQAFANAGGQNYFLRKRQTSYAELSTVKAVGRGRQNGNDNDRREERKWQREAGGSRKRRGMRDVKQGCPLLI